MIKNSIRQMKRTPLKTALFLVLMLVSCLLVVMGTNLFFISAKMQNEAEGAFTTIGTVEQRVAEYVTSKYWDSMTQSYVYGKKKVYGEPVPDTVLDIEGMPYIHKPVQQPFYTAYKEDYVVRNSSDEVDQSVLGIASDCVVAEVEPYEDCVPDHPVKLHFKRSLFGNYTEEVLNTIWFWDMENPEPDPLYSGKTYVMALYMNQHLDYYGALDREKYPEVTVVWVPWLDISGAQYTKDGGKQEDKAHEDRYYSEVTEGFYGTDEGRRWMNLVKGFNLVDYSIPVIPTDATKLLMYFYKGDAGISQGRDITKEEYKSGKKVCLVQEGFAKDNDLKVGDKLELPLYVADYSQPASRKYSLWASRTMGEKWINADGELYRPFFDEEYEVVGIYQVYSGMDSFTGYEAAKHGVIIPAASVTSSDENNIIAYEPMKGCNTSFQIENGKTDEFWELWNKQGIDNLDITFYDGGYGELEQSFQNTRKMSVVLLGAGIGTVLLILLFFCHMFVTKQKLRTAVERSLGMTTRQCRVSLMSGILLTTAIGCIAGGIAGAVFTRTAASTLSQGTGYSTAFSAGKAVVEQAVSSAGVMKDEKMLLVLPAVTAIGVFAAAFIIAEIMVRKNLREEPMELLSKMKNET